MTAALAVAMVIALVGGVISGLAGFGFALVVVPLLLLLYEPPTVTAMAVSLTLATGWLVLLGAWRNIEWRTVLALLPGAIAGTFAGIWLLQTIDAAWIKLIASLVVLFFAISTMRGWSFAAVDSKWAPPIAGLASGTLNGSTGMAGPPVAMLFASRNYSVQSFRTSIVAYFYIIDLVVMALLLQRGIVGRAELRTVLTLLPAAIIGGFIGRHAIKRFSPVAFRQLTLLLLLMTGLVGVVAASHDLIWR